MITVIAAVQKKDNAIGKNNALLVSLSGDLRRFQALTKGHPVIMGRKTYQSLPDPYRPLPGRTNIVVSSQNLELPLEVFVTHSLSDAILRAKTIDNDIFIIGGASIYAETIKEKIADRLELTLIESDFEGDTFFPPWEHYGTITQSLSATDEKTGLKYTFVTIEK